jgi:hypothetical protein
VAIFYCKHELSCSFVKTKHESKSRIVEIGQLGTGSGEGGSQLHGKT